MVIEARVDIHAGDVYGPSVQPCGVHVKVWLPSDNTKAQAQHVPGHVEQLLKRNRSSFRAHETTC